MLGCPKDQGSHCTRYDIQKKIKVRALSPSFKNFVSYGLSPTKESPVDCDPSQSQQAVNLFPITLFATYLQKHCSSIIFLLYVQRGSFLASNIVSNIPFHVFCLLKWCQRPLVKYLH